MVASTSDWKNLILITLMMEAQQSDRKSDG
jgi:hypothetical protein